MKHVIVFGVLFFVCWSCIDPLKIDIVGHRVLVVDGMITDQVGPYTVKIFYSGTLYDPKITALKGAHVSIIADDGESEILREVGPGNYQTATLAGVTGRTYHLRIITSDGYTYESLSEKLLPVGDLLKLYTKFVLKDSTDRIDPASRTNGFDILIDGALLPEQNGLMRWRWSGTFGFNAYPGLQTKPVPLTGKLVPDPPPCSGMIVLPFLGFTQVGGCLCCYCWVTQHNLSPVITQKSFSNTTTLTGVNLGFIPSNRRFFSDKYYLEVEQLSLSQEAYDFWAKIGSQRNSASDLFQTPPQAAQGNIHAVTDGAPAVIGLFSASSIKKKVLVLRAKDIPYRILSIDTIKESCAAVYQGATTDRPSFW
jgi:Domain of unknown function (DUF4249)